MAEAENVNIETIPGKEAKLIVKKSNPKNIVSSRFKNDKPARSSIALKYINNFPIFANLADQIISYPLLKQIWDNVRIQGLNSLQHIIYRNIQALDEDNFSTENIITPAGLFIDPVYISYEEEDFYVNFMLDEEENEDLKLPAILFIFFCFNGNNKSIHSVTEIIEESVYENCYSFDINLPAIIKSALQKDPHPFVYIAASSIVPNKEKIYWTSTCAVQL